MNTNQRRGSQDAFVIKKDDVDGLKINDLKQTEPGNFSWNTEIVKESFLERFGSLMLKVLGLLILPLIFITYFMFFFQK